VDEGLCKKIQTPLMLGSDARVGIQRCPNCLWTCALCGCRKYDRANARVSRGREWRQITFKWWTS
jgi:RNase P subunit RPR2